MADPRDIPEAPEVHVYDGIEEHDNSLPNWWLNLLYATIAFAIAYFGYYVMGDGPSLVREYERAKAQRENAELELRAKVKPATEEDLARLVPDPTRRAAGLAIFRSRCVSCHGSEGGGGIGPNLADAFWIHGGKLTDIAQTIRAGVLDKGMPPWSGQLGPEEISSLVVFVRSLRGSAPAGAKAPQGEPFRE
jgi:cytochrome c oxidase cbb3-type subunit 3